MTPWSVMAQAGIVVVGGRLEHLADTACPVQHRVLGMSMKMNETHSYSTLDSWTRTSFLSCLTLVFRTCRSRRSRRPANYNGVRPPYDSRPARASSSGTSRHLSSDLPIWVAGPRGRSENRSRRGRPPSLTAGPWAYQDLEAVDWLWISRVTGRPLGCRRRPGPR